MLKKFINFFSNISRVFLTMGFKFSAREFVFVILAVFGIFIFSQADAAINQKINYQGKLTDSTGVAVSDGAYDVVFKLYTAGGGI